MPRSTASKTEKELTAENAELRERLARFETAQAAELTGPAQAEALLRDSEENFRSLVAALSEGIVMQNAAGEIVTCNASAERILGLTKDQMTGRTSIDPRWRSVRADGSPFPGEEHPSMVTLRTGEPQRNIIMGVHLPDGGLHWISINSEPLFRQSESLPYAVVVTFADVTEQKQNEEELRKLAHAVEHGPASVIITNLLGEIEYANPKFTETTGYSLAEVINQNPRILKSGNTNPSEYEGLWSTITSGREWHGEFHNRKKNGDLYWEKASIAPVLNKTGEITHFIAIKEDITEQKRIADELTTAAKRNQILLETANDGIHVLDTDGNVVEANAAFCSMLGYTRNEVLAFHVSDWDTRWSGDELLAKVREIMASPAVFETRHRRKDGSVIDVEINGVGVVLEGKGYLYAAARDITHRKLAEAELQRVSQLLKSVIESSGDIISMMDAEYRYQLFNTAFYEECRKIYGKDFKPGDSIKDLLAEYPEDLAAAIESWGRVFAGEDLTFTREFGDTAKERNWYELHFSPIADRDGLVRGGVLTARNVSDRIRSEEILRETRDRLDFAMEQADLAYWELDAATNKFTFNDKFYELYATTAENEGGYVMDPDVYTREFIPADEQRLHDLDIGELISGEVDDWRLEHAIRRRDGELRNIAVRVNVLRNAEGSVIGTRGSNQDITERVRAEDALRTSELKLRSILDSSRDAIGVHVDGIWEMANPAAVKLFGVSSVDDLLGTPIFDVIAPSERETVKEYVRTRKTGGEAPIAYVTRGLRRDGTEFDMDVTLSEFDLEGQSHILVVLRDITEQLRSREKIESLQHLLSNVINTTPYIVFANDLEHRPIFGNDALFKFMGKPEAEVIGRPINELFPAEMLDGFVSANETVIASGETISFGETVFGREYLTTKFPIRNKANEIVGVGGIIIDMTERAKQEEELRREETLKAVGTLAGGIAHEFNNLMTVVTGFSELALQNVETDNRLKPQIEQIMEAGTRAAELTHQLLAFGQKQFLRPQPIDLNTAVSNMDGLLRRTLPANIVITTHLEPHLCPIKADPDRINEVILNLAVHARDQMADGGVLTISTRNVDGVSLSGFGQIAAAQKYVILTIADTGLGVGEVELQRMFDPYFSTKGIGHGAGITMAAVYGIVKQSGGDIKVQSGEGNGSTFEIVFPCLESGSATK